MTTELGTKILNILLGNSNVGEWDYSCTDVADIAKALGITKNAVKGAMITLIQDGLIYTYDWEGALENPNLVTIHLTKQGWAQVGHPEALTEK